MMESTTVLAHGSGLDDLLYIYGPIFLLVLISWMKMRRAAKRRNHEEDPPQ